MQNPTQDSIKEKGIAKATIASDLKALASEVHVFQKNLQSFFGKKIDLLIQNKDIAGIVTLSETGVTNDAIDNFLLQHSEEVYKYIEARSQKKGKGFSIEFLLKMPKEIKNQFLSDLSDKDLDAFEISLGKGKNIAKKDQPAFQNLHTLITEIRNKRILNELLNDHPEWQPMINAWGNIVITDKIWLIRLYELHALEVPLPQLTLLHAASKSVAPSPDSLKLLQQKKEIGEELSKVKIFISYAMNLKKSPKAICLLPNLNRITIMGSPDLHEPPDVRHFPKLQVLFLDSNGLTVSPDVRWNPELEVLSLEGNKLTLPPDVSQNSHLKRVNVTHNQISRPIDLSNNLELWEVEDKHNPFSTTQ